MTATVTPPTDPGFAPDPVAVDVRVLDADAVLDQVVAHRAAADASEARVLMLAVHYVDLHPVTREHPAATAAMGDPMLGVRDLAAVPDAPKVTELLAGAGTPGIAQYAVEELGAVLGVPYLTAYSLCADSVAVCYRLPRIWDRVHAGLVPAWRATLVARETHALSTEAAGFVDRQVAVLIDRRRFPTMRVLRDLVHEARLRMDPDHEQAMEEKALASRGVWFDHQTSTASAATTTMTATLDAWDALTLDAALTGFAQDLRAVGDTQDLDVLRAEALAMLADPQRVLDLGAAAVTADSTADNTADGDADGSALAPASAPAQRSRSSVIHLYVHVSLADLARAGLTPCEDPDPDAGSAQARPAAEDSWGWGRLGGAARADAADRPPHLARADRPDRPASGPGPHRPEHPRYKGRSTSTTRHRRCGTSSPCATGSACSPDAGSTPDPATSTTPWPTSTPTTVAHPVRPILGTWPVCVAATIGSRPSPAGTTSKIPIAATRGSAPAARPTSPTRSPKRAPTR